jgi:hypothetical protein
MDEWGFPRTFVLPLLLLVLLLFYICFLILQDVQLVYSDELYSQEEKRALLPKYAAARRQQGASHFTAAGAGLQQHHMASHGIPQAVPTAAGSAAH